MLLACRCLPLRSLVCDRRIPAAQEHVDQLCQVIAVAAFENCGGWNFYGSQAFPDSREIAAFQRHLSNWVVRIRIEPR